MEGSFSSPVGQRTNTQIVVIRPVVMGQASDRTPALILPRSGGGARLRE